MTSPSAQQVRTAGAGIVLLTLCAGQFLMALDSSVMNVSIAQVANDIGTTVTGIQTAITAYTLVMATLMITGGRLGEIWGRKRAFSIGAVIYGAGSLTTALAPNLAVLLLGWSLLEGIGAALILPAVVALVASNVPAPGRPKAYGAIAASAAIAIAVGPLIGGLCATYFSWRLVFAGEVVLVLVILLLSRKMQAAPGTPAKLDLIGTALSAAALGLIVYGILRAGSWGFVRPKGDAPSFLGLSLVVWMILSGLVLLLAFAAWERRLERTGGAPLVRLQILEHAQLRAGLFAFFFQFLVQMGLFFVVPLYLAVALGLSTIATGIRILPLSIGLLAAAALVPRIWPHASPRRIVRIGFVALLAGVVILMGALDIGSGPEIVLLPLLLAGLGMGALASQLGSVTVSAVADEEAAQVGGLQNTVTNLGASIGTALAGAILIAALTSTLLTGLAADSRVPQAIADQASVTLDSGAPFVSDAQLETVLTEAGTPTDVRTAILEQNTNARLAGLRMALAVLAMLTVVALFFTGGIPTTPAVGALEDPSAAISHRRDS
ncbi:MAG: MFS transporter [Acidimicrobiia bacterium]